MPIPKKIDDNLRDAVIDIQFNPAIPATAITGYFHKVLLEKGFDVINNPSLMIPPILGMIGGNTQQQIRISGAQIVQPLYTNKKIKITISNFSINFNIIGKYIGWAEYFPLIKDILSSIYQTGAIENFIRVGVRYISEYRNISVFDFLKGEFKILDDKSKQNTQIKTQIEDGNYRIIVSIADNFIRPSTENQADIEKFSLIDIDAHYYGPPVADLNKFMEIIDETHGKETGTFFYDIVTQKFIDEHNPQY